MALQLNKLAQAISEVMAGVDEGIEQAREYVEVVNPPEKVVFSTDAIVALNSIERIQTRATEPSVKTVVTTNLLETISINGNQEGLISLPETTTNTTVEITSGGETTKKSYEDQAVGFVFEYPGPKSS